MERFSDHLLFSGLPQATLKQLADKAITKTYTSQEIIVYQEDVWPYLFFVDQGKIHATKESLEGRAFIATTLIPGDIFWGLAFFIDEAPMPVMLQANSDAVIYRWSRDYLVPMIKANGVMSWNLCQIMIKRMQLASDIVEDLAFQPIMGRLAGLLIDLSGDADGEFIARELTLEEMAARIGTTREMVCRHLYRFAEKGAIQINRTELKIVDRELLQNQARK
ncbi:MAG: Crp/Fnr family transcriptional regulator [Anaerolineales bacterium]